ncbi:MAG: hypothetical protein R3Y63_04755 [Eubacteriales bacterium]
MRCCLQEKNKQTTATDRKINPNNTAPSSLPLSTELPQPEVAPQKANVGQVTTYKLRDFLSETEINHPDFKDKPVYLCANEEGLVTTMAFREAEKEIIAYDPLIAQTGKVPDLAAINLYGVDYNPDFVLPRKMKFLHKTTRIQNMRVYHPKRKKFLYKTMWIQNKRVYHPKRMKFYKKK